MKLVRHYKGKKCSIPPPEIRAREFEEIWETFYFFIGEKILSQKRSLRSQNVC